MTAPAKRRATFEDLLALPSNQVGQILDGELHAQPRPAARHARVASALGSRIGGPFDYDDDGPGGWIILREPELHLGPGPDVLVPDLAGWRRARIPELPEAAAFELAPDWACEVLSPSTASLDRTIKMDIYARERVGHVWLCDPSTELVEIYRGGKDMWVRVAGWHGNQKLRAEPFEAIELDLRALWSR